MINSRGFTSVDFVIRPLLNRRMFGEHITARKFPNMVKEIFLKATLYNMFNQMA